MGLSRVWCLQGTPSTNQASTMSCMSSLCLSGQIALVFAQVSDADVMALQRQV